MRREGPRFDVRAAYRDLLWRWAEVRVERRQALAEGGAWERQEELRRLEEALWALRGAVMRGMEAEAERLVWGECSEKGSEEEQEGRKKPALVGGGSERC